MTRLLYLLIFSISLLLVSCNTEQKNKSPENLKTNTRDDLKLLSESELNTKTLSELKLIRNEIYARKGYIFKDNELREFFSQKKWYVPQKDLEIILSEKEKENVNLINKIEAKRNNLISNKPKISQVNGYRDTIDINYNKNKGILDILTLFPETNMGSWDWSQKDRIDLVNDIKINNFIIDTTEMFLNIKYVKPNTMGLTVVDGFWTLSVYDIDSNNKIIITNDIVGDGNSFETYELKNNELKIVNSDILFGDYFSKLLKNNSQECKDMLEDNMITFDYDFSNPEFIKISSWHINEEENQCFNGNTITLKLNKSKRLFETYNILWEENK